MTDKTLYEKLKEYAKNHPEGFTVKIVNGKITPVKGSKEKRFVVSKTNFDTPRKQRIGFTDNYSGYAGGWFDVNTKKYFIDKNKIFRDKLKALQEAKSNRQLAIFDLVEQKEIRVQKPRKVVVKRNGKWFNTLTKRYVSESTAKRYNSYFSRKPQATLTEAYGGYQYSEGEKFDKLAKHTKKVFRKSNQLVKTKDMYGKTIYYSPIHDEVVKPKTVKKFKRLDYSICNGKIRVRLYRLTRLKDGIYHVFEWKINKGFHSDIALETWFYGEGVEVMNCMLNEVYKVAQKENLGNQSMYGHIQLTYYINEGIDFREASRTFGYGYRPELKTHIHYFSNDFSNLLNSIITKLSENTYHIAHVDKVSIFIRSVNPRDIARILSKYRHGVLNIMNGS